MKPEFQKIAYRIYQLKQLGNSDEKIVEVIKSLELPFGLHIAIMGHFSSITSGDIFKPKILRGRI